MRVMVLGGDGFCGWPTSLHLSARGHDVVIVDNFSRRARDGKPDADSLTPIRPLDDRLAVWRALSGRAIDFRLIDIGHDFAGLVEAMRAEEPDVVVHLAGQRAFPRAMRTNRQRRGVAGSDIDTTHNVLCAMVEAAPDAHLVHLGRMVNHGRAPGLCPPARPVSAALCADAVEVRTEIRYPAGLGCIQPIPGMQDVQLFQFYATNERLRITNLRQGIVWGTDTEETAADVRMINRFDYDGGHGTEFNRFVIQAALGHPLTIHGAGGQIRAFIHIRDTVRCIERAILNSPRRGERMRIQHQMTECHKVRDLAHLIAVLADTEVRFFEIPGQKVTVGDPVVANDTLYHLGGARPIRLTDGLMHEVAEVARKYAHRCDPLKIQMAARW